VAEGRRAVGRDVETLDERRGGLALLVDPEDLELQVLMPVRLVLVADGGLPGAIAVVLVPIPPCQVGGAAGGVGGRTRLSLLFLFLFLLVLVTAVGPAVGHAVWTRRWRRPLHRRRHPPGPLLVATVLVATVLVVGLVGLVVGVARCLCGTVVLETAGSREGDEGKNGYQQPVLDHAGPSVLVEVVLEKTHSSTWSGTTESLHRASDPLRST
jgi:hypothetical protein